MRSGQSTSIVLIIDKDADNRRRLRDYYLSKFHHTAKNRPKIYLAKDAEDAWKKPYRFVSVVVCMVDFPEEERIKLGQMLSQRQKSSSIIGVPKNLLIYR